EGNGTLGCPSQVAGPAATGGSLRMSGSISAGARPARKAFVRHSLTAPPTSRACWRRTRSCAHGCPPRCWRGCCSRSSVDDGLDRVGHEPGAHRELDDVAVHDDVLVSGGYGP